MRALFSKHFALSGALMLSLLLSIGVECPRPQKALLGVLVKQNLGVDQRWPDLCSRTWYLAVNHMPDTPKWEVSCHCCVYYKTKFRSPQLRV